MNTKQHEAVTHFDAPLLVLAGAGSGKTRVITEKIAEILRRQLAMPSQILAVTFTNKAASEMLERVQKLVEIEGRYLNIGTFHRMALKMLRRYADVIGYTKNFTILDSSDQKKVIASLLKRLQIVDDVKPQTVSGYISKIKENFIKPHELEGALHNFPDTYTKIKMVKIYEEYQKELKRLDGMDFDDLIFNCVDLLKNNQEIRSSYQNLFKYILIDEYQDINSLQQKWIKLIAGENKNITCVGDDDQSIYGWRGSNISYILGFSKENSNAKIIKLEQNYRSTKDILNVASKLIQHNTGRHGKTLWTETSQTDTVKVNVYQDSKAEARAITNTIQEFNHKYNNKDIGILVRTIRQTRSIEEGMVFAGIAYKIIGGLRFYERREVKDIIAYIKVLVSSEDDLATERVIATPKKGIGDASIDKLYDFARKHQTNLLTEILTLQTCNIVDTPSNHSHSSQDDLFFGGNNTKVGEHNQGISETELIRADSGLHTRAMNKLEVLGKQIHRWREKLNSDSIANVIKYALKEIEYEEYLKKDDDQSFEQRVENINELLTTLESFETAEEFLDYVSLATSVDDNENNNDAVNIMTIHASKGLEFPFVFLPGWNQGLFPSERTVEELGLAGIEEERRLAYVATTRAREKLHISSTKFSFARQGFSFSTEKSMFLDEILEFAEESIEFSDNSSYGGYDSYTRVQKSKDFSSPVAHAFVAQKESNFYVGNLVSHAKFGIGTVVKVVGTLVTTKFSDGQEKTIREDFLKRKHI